MSKDAVVVEWAQFELKEGVREEALLEASRTLQKDFLERQAGFVRRELLRGKGRQWVDLIHWKDQSSIDAAMAKVGDSAVCSAYFALMSGMDHADASGGVLQFERVEAYERR